MANVSEVSVDIAAVHCFKELKDYIKAVDKNAFYNICDIGEEVNSANNSGELYGDANGRWAYGANLRGAFGDKETRHHWVKDKKVWTKYDKLIETIHNDEAAEFEIRYTEFEPGMGFVAKGRLYMSNEDGKVTTDIDEESADATPESLVEYGIVNYLNEAKEMLGIE